MNALHEISNKTHNNTLQLLKDEETRHSKRLQTTAEGTQTKTQDATGLGPSHGQPVAVTASAKLK